MAQEDEAKEVEEKEKKSEVVARTEKGPIRVPPGTLTDMSDYLTRQDEILEQILKVNGAIYNQLTGQPTPTPKPPTPTPPEGGENPNIGSTPLFHSKFEQEYTTTGVDVAPGEKKEILTYDPRTDQKGFWLETGTTDKDNSLYYHVVDDFSLFRKESIDFALGTFAEPYKFPNPIPFEDKISIEVKRPKTAHTTETFYSCFRVLKMDEDVFNELKQRATL